MPTPSHCMRGRGLAPSGYPASSPPQAPLPLSSLIPDAPVTTRFEAASNQKSKLTKNFSNCDECVILQAYVYGTICTLGAPAQSSLRDRRSPHSTTTLPQP